MRRVRAYFRLARTIAVTAAAYATWAVGHLGLIAASEPRKRRWRRAVMRRWCTAVCRALAVRVRVVGAPPTGGAFVVCNHLSYLDIPVLGSCLPTTFVSKAEIADWPVIGALARQFDTVFLVRERKRDLPAVNEAVLRTLRAGDGIVVFPEGTSTAGADVLPFRPSLLAPAAEGALEVWPASVTYSSLPAEPPASLAVCWWGDMEFAPHVAALARLDSIEAVVEFAAEPIVDRDRKRLAEKLLGAVKSRFRPVP